MKKILIGIIVFICVMFALQGFCSHPYISENKIEEAANFVNKNGYSNYCIFVDFSQYTSKKRFMLYDLKSRKILYSCKCAHGNDGSGTIETTKSSFSNVQGSHKSSLGKYRIGKKRTIRSVDGMFNVSMYGIPCYEMHGLDSSNSNAYKRGILIHPDYFLSNMPTPIFPFHSFGCFSIPNNSFKEIAKIIDKEKRPILLYAYYKY